MSLVYTNADGRRRGTRARARVKDAAGIRGEWAASVVEDARDEARAADAALKAAQKPNPKPKPKAETDAAAAEVKAKPNPKRKAVEAEVDDFCIECATDLCDDPDHQQQEPQEPRAKRSKTEEKSDKTEKKQPDEKALDKLAIETIEQAHKRMDDHFARMKTAEAKAMEVWRKSDEKSKDEKACFVRFGTIMGGFGTAMGSTPIVGSDPSQPYVFPYCVWGVIPGRTTWAEMLTTWPQFRHLCTKGAHFEQIETLCLRLCLKGPDGTIVAHKKGDSHQQPGYSDNTLRDLSLPIIPAGMAGGSSITAYVVMFGPECDMLELPFRLLEQGRSWPPCSNWGGDEPITMLKVGLRRERTPCSDAHGQRDKYIPEHDNSMENMVVIHTGGDGPGLAYNKYSYINAVTSAGGRDPTTRKRVSSLKQAEIKEAGHFDVVSVL